MKKTTKNTGIKVNAGVKAGGLVGSCNHTGRGLKVAAGLKAGSLIQGYNHSRNALSLA